MIYILDTNVITDLMKEVSSVVDKVRQMQSDHILCISQPIDYEIMRGLTRKIATTQITRYETLIKPRFQWIPLMDADWEQAAQFWANVTNAGKQLSDMDLLIGAIVKHLNATLITADDDFTAIPILRDNWRTA